MTGDAERAGDCTISPKKTPLLFISSDLRARYCSNRASSSGVSAAKICSDAFELTCCTAISSSLRLIPEPSSSCSAFNALLSLEICHEDRITLFEFGAAWSSERDGTTVLSSESMLGIRVDACLVVVSSLSFWDLVTWFSAAAPRVPKKMVLVRDFPSGLGRLNASCRGRPIAGPGPIEG